MLDKLLLSDSDAALSDAIAQLSLTEVSTLLERTSRVQSLCHQRLQQAALAAAADEGPSLLALPPDAVCSSPVRT